MEHRFIQKELIVTDSFQG